MRVFLVAAGIGFTVYMAASGSPAWLIACSAGLDALLVLGLLIGSRR